MQTYPINGGLAVNYFNAGEYIEFYVTLDKSGLYSASYYVGTGNATGAAVGLKATDDKGALADKSVTPVVSQATDGWDVFYTLQASSQLNLFQGAATIRIYGAGTADFQFNIDRITFTRLGDADLTLDADGDGVADVNDTCASTPAGEQANGVGCSPSQLDTDVDGITDNLDLCPNTASGAFVDAKGCESSGGDDDDFDSVLNADDQCPATPFGINVTANGCALSAGNDADNDGVANSVDQCAATPVGEFANEKGCSASQVGNTVAANISVNANIRHTVNGVSDFGRSRHMTVHSGVHENDWLGNTDKLNYLVNTLDVYMGRDNGSATWKFADTTQDPLKPNWPNLDYMITRGKELREDYAANPLFSRFDPAKTEMIAGTNPHPTYPTLSWYENAMTWHNWQPKTIESSAAWMGQYMANYFGYSGNNYVGEPLPKYWEVINEPDMKMKTGQFMVTNQEQIWEYHNLVAEQIRSKLGNEAPMIGGMTWGLHDFFRRDGLSRLADDAYDQWITVPGDPAAEAEAEAFYENAMRTSVDDTRAQDWYQWDVMWKGFMDAAGHNMDFYSVHIYDWPSVSYGGNTVVRRGGHANAMFEMMEWYDQYEHGFANRKPIVLSEYGAVQGGWDSQAHQERFDITNLKAFNGMLMQFLDRPDYVIKSMPFTPAKPIWGYLPGGCAYKTVPDCTTRYHYAMLTEPELNKGNWQWSSYIKFFELWANVDGARVDSVSTDPDVQVQSYVDGNDLFVIINNLEAQATTVNLNVAGLAGSLQNVEMRSMHFSNSEQETHLDRQHMKQVPKSLTLEADATVVLRYTMASSIAVNKNMVEKKYFGNSLSGGNLPHRISVNGGAKTVNVNNVSVPSGYAEAKLMLTVALFPGPDDVAGGVLSIDSLKVNGVAVTPPIDWRGPKINANEKYFNTLEIPVPVSALQANNVIEVDFHHNGELVVGNLIVKTFDATPAR